MKRLAATLVVLAALCPLASHGGEREDEIRAERRIHGEPSVGRQILALPYGVVALTGWPLGKAIDWMEDENLPARVEDFVLYPVRRLRRAEKQP